LEGGMVKNLYPLHYLLRLMPLPNSIKTGFLPRFQGSALGKWKFWVPLGNLYLVAQKPKLAS